LEFFHFKTLRKYTASLLDMFSSIVIQRRDDDGVPYDTFFVPIEFASKSKAYIFSNTDIERLKSGNVNILPRMSLTISGLSAAKERNTSKFQKINFKPVDDSFIEYQQNSVSYDFKYVLSIATRNLEDMSIILEQILPQFTPSRTIRIRELDEFADFTSVQVLLEDVSIEVPETIEEDFDIRIIKADLQLTVRGNIYPPFKGFKKSTKTTIGFGVAGEYYMDDLPDGIYKFLSADGSLVSIVKKGGLYSVTIEYPDTYTPAFFSGLKVFKDFDGKIYMTKKNLPDFSITIDGDGCAITDGLTTYTLMQGQIYFATKNASNFVEGKPLQDTETASVITRISPNFVFESNITVTVPDTSIQKVFDNFDSSLFTDSNPIKKMSMGFGSLNSNDFPSKC
jgi:hypothetical protein